MTFSLTRLFIFKMTSTCRVSTWATRTHRPSLKTRVVRSPQLQVVVVRPPHVLFPFYWLQIMFRSLSKVATHRHILPESTCVKCCSFPLRIVRESFISTLTLSPCTHTIIFISGFWKNESVSQMLLSLLLPSPAPCDCFSGSEVRSQAQCQDRPGVAQEKWPGRPEQGGTR